MRHIDKTLWMSGRAILVFGLTLLALTPAAQSKKSQPGFSPCDRPWTIEIDATSGVIQCGSERFPQDAQVLIELINKEPFRCKYELANGLQALKVPGPDGVLGILGLVFKFPKIPGDQPDPKEPLAAFISAEKALQDQIDDFDAKQQILERSSRAKLGIPSCPFADIQRLRSLSIQLQGAQNQLSKVQGDFAETGPAGSAYARAKASLEKFQEAVGTRLTRRDELSEIRRDLLFFSVGISRAEVQEIITTVKRTLETLEELGIRSPECEPKPSQLIVAARDLVDGANKLSASLEDAAKDEKQFKAIATRIAQVLADPDAFQSRTALPVYEQPQRGKLSFIRTCQSVSDPSQKAEKSEVTYALSIGMPRFSISGGVGLGDFKQASISREKSLVPDSMDMAKMKLGERFLVLEESDPTPLGVLLWNTRFTGLGKRASFGWSLGLTISDDKEASTFGLTTGPTLGFFNDNVFVTLGYHTRKRDHLGGGFSDGDVIPDDLKEIPIRRKSEDGILLAFTFRLRPAG